MTDKSTTEPVTQDPDQQARWPWWMYVTLGFFALGIAAVILGVRTCL